MIAPAVLSVQKCQTCERVRSVVKNQKSTATTWYCSAHGYDWLLMADVQCRRYQASVNSITRWESNKKRLDRRPGVTNDRGDDE